MSIHVSTLVWQIPMPMPTKLVMLKLADNANEDGSNVRPAQTTVARQCGCSVRTVQRVIQELLESGILLEIPTPGNRPNEYRFDMVAVRQRVTLTESHPDRESTTSHSRASTSHSRASTSESHPINKNRQLTVIEPSLGETKKKRPDLGEWLAYAESIEFPPDPAEEAWNHYEMVGWKYGKSHHDIKDWKRACVTSRGFWKKRPENGYAERKRPPKVVSA